MPCLRRRLVSAVPPRGARRPVKPLPDSVKDARPVENGKMPRRQHSPQLVAAAENRCTLRAPTMHPQRVWQKLHSLWRSASTCVARRTAPTAPCHARRTMRCAAPHAPALSAPHRTTRAAQPRAAHHTSIARPRTMRAHVPASNGNGFAIFSSYFTVRSTSRPKSMSFPPHILLFGNISRKIFRVLTVGDKYTKVNLHYGKILLKTFWILTVRTRGAEIRVEIRIEI